MNPRDSAESKRGCWRTAASFRPSEQSVGIDEIGAGSLLGIGHLVAQDRGGISPASCRAGQACESRWISDRRRPPRPCRPRRRRLFRTARGCRARPRPNRHAWRERPRAPAPPPDGSGLRAAQAPRARRAHVRPGWFDSTPSAPVVPGNRASIAATRRAVAALQAMHDRVGVEHWHAFGGEHRRHGRFTHADRSGEAEDDHVANMSRMRRKASNGRSGRPSTAKWPPSIWSRTIARPGLRFGSCPTFQRTASYSRSR